MSTGNIDKASASASSQWLKQLELFATVNTRILESMTRLAELNMHASQDLLENSSSTYQHLLSPDKPSEAIQAQPLVDSALTYSQQVAAIALDIRSEVTHLTRENIVGANQQIAAQLSDLASNAPDGARDVISFMQVTCNNINSACDHILKASELTTEAMASSLNGNAHKSNSGKSKVAKRAHVN